MSSSMAVGVGLIEIASITVDVVYHVAFVICDDGKILGSNVVQ